jgi:hypothetical protein
MCEITTTTDRAPKTHDPINNFPSDVNNFPSGVKEQNFWKLRYALATAALAINGFLDKVKEAFVEIGLDCDLNNASANLHPCGS